MKREFLQVRSDHGYLIHAVDARGQRSGLFNQYIGGRPICGKITGRVNGFSTLRLQFPTTMQYKEPLAFIPEEVTARPVTEPACQKCVTRVLQDNEP